jgi:hypothetical protein
MSTSTSTEQASASDDDDPKDSSLAFRRTQASSIDGCKRLQFNLETTKNLFKGAAVKYDVPDQPRGIAELESNRVSIPLVVTHGLGQGGFSVVVHAFHEATGAPYAIKVHVVIRLLCYGRVRLFFKRLNISLGMPR